MAFLHTPYAKPDVELERSALAGDSAEYVDADETASVVENHADIDKVNHPQAQSWSEFMEHRVTNIPTGFCRGDPRWRVSII